MTSSAEEWYKNVSKSYLTFNLFDSYDDVELTEEDYLLSEKLNQ